ncbi:predicted protein [Sclerotinia sclerotiorum 1980 UF-70]|uniref:Uncharacterized protein n=1 Tax=Sclerotinia sclerotiorum (strain ATCC 18683 / 1980 / Ss-1) TaxID=665079 RepID=A7EI55_SCLS1|nr:predicted protein [Sclerotinia sclerotiorum 1980 UF-70]EDO02521.1 predicted protein [Sclerotinia sclerotiorum 1980 UF-70]
MGILLEIDRNVDCTGKETIRGMSGEEDSGVRQREESYTGRIWSSLGNCWFVNDGKTNGRVVIVVTCRKDTSREVPRSWAPVIFYDFHRLHPIYPFPSVIHPGTKTPKTDKDYEVLQHLDRYNFYPKRHVRRPMKRVKHRSVTVLSNRVRKTFKAASLD